MPKNIRVSLIKTVVSFAIIATVTLTAVPKSSSATLAFSSLSADDLAGIIADFGAVFAHSSVSPATQLGGGFGFELGLVGGLAKTPRIKSLADAASPGSDVKYLPDAGILVAVSVPMGFKFELELLPTLSGYGVGLKKTSYAIQWNLTDTVLPLPVDLAFKFHSSVVTASFSQDVLGTVEDVQIQDSIRGYDLIVSKSFVLLEPYLGFGLIQAFGDVNLSGGTNSIFAFTNSLSVSSSVKSYEVFAGGNLHLAHFNFGLEVARLFSTSRALMKLSASF